MIATIPYKNNLPMVSIWIIGNNNNNNSRRIVIEAHLDFASSKTIVPTHIAKELDLAFAGSEETVTGAGMIYMPYYEASVEVFGTVYDNILVGCLDFPELTPARALLGRDILDNYKVCLDGKRKKIEVC